MTATTPRTGSPESVQKIHSEISLGVAAFLVTQGVSLLRCEPTANRGQFAFVFSNEKDEASAALLHYASRATCVAADLVNAIESLKALLRNVKGGGAR